ncbi:phosphopantetheine-binding protein [Streptomyces sp. NPDC101132]|uniref:phosphopantetheine-binding protein n=1 Tax=Streptomyces sp. NPDC101132 TaxID=3366110 RepID=UPI0037FC1869
MSDAVLAVLIDTLVTRFDTPPGSADAHTPLGQSAVDSLALVELGLLLEERLGTPVPEGVLHPDQTLREAAQALAALDSPHPAATPSA